MNCGITSKSTILSSLETLPPNLSDYYPTHLHEFGSCLVTAIANFEANVISLLIQPLAVGILCVVGCFVVIIDTAAVTIVSGKSWNAYCFSG